MTWTVWLGFLLASFVIAITPGPGAVISMSTGLRHGYRSALIAILGLQTAILVHLGIVALGLGALVATSDTAFGIVKFCGAAYLLWLGVLKWRAPVVALDAELEAGPAKGVFLQGLLVNMTNPKAIVFIAALVPQFIDPAAALLQQYLTIGATLCLTDMTVMSGYALMAERLGRWLHNPAHLRLQNRAFGGLFVSAGALLAISSRGA